MNKKAGLILIALTLSLFSFAQADLPSKAEDISPLLIGESFPDTPIKNLDGDEVAISDFLKEQPAVIVFYRGGWCPYCTKHLSALGQAEQEILDLGVKIIAISPDSGEKLKETLDQNELPYELLSDSNGDLAKAVGIAFQAPERYLPRLSKYSDGGNTGYLPVPSVFILNQQGEILFEYISPNYKQRISKELLLATLKAL